MTSIYAAYNTTSASGATTYTWTGYANLTTVGTAGNIKFGKITGTLQSFVSSSLGASSVMFQMSFKKNGSTVKTITNKLKTTETCAGKATISATGESDIDYEFSPDDVDTISITVGAGTAQSWAVTDLDYSYPLAYYLPDTYKYGGLNLTVTRKTSVIGGATGTVSLGDAVYESDILRYEYSVKDGYYINGNVQLRGVTSSGSITLLSIGNGSYYRISDYSMKTALLSVPIYVYEYTVTLDNQSSGKVEASLNRISSPKQGAATGTIASGSAVYDGDVIKVNSTVVEGLEAVVSPSSQETVDGDLTFIVTAIPYATIRMYRNRKWTEYAIYVGDGEKWNLSQANIMENGSWKVYT